MVGTNPMTTSVAMPAPSKSSDNQDKGILEVRTKVQRMLQREIQSATEAVSSYVSQTLSRVSDYFDYVYPQGYSV
jgi:hypothetical protein